MKIRIIVALVATSTIIFLSCNWFRSRKTEVSNALVGDWKLDSVKTGKDTSFVYFLISSAVQDAGGINFSFTKDSIYTHSANDIDTIAYSFDEKLSQLSIRDSSNEQLTFFKLNDSLVTLSTKDSTVFFLRRK